MLIVLWVRLHMSASARMAGLQSPCAQSWKKASEITRKRALSDVPKTPAERHVPLVAPAGTMAVTHLPEDGTELEDALSHITSLLVRAQISPPHT